MLPSAKRIFDADHIATVGSMSVTHVEVYIQRQWTSLYFHAFVVLKTNNGAYISLEKQTDGIYIGQSNKIDNLKYCFGKDLRIHPVLKGTSGYSYCQHFAEHFFYEVAQTKSLDFQKPLEFLGITLNPFLVIILVVPSLYVLMCYYLCASLYNKYYICKKLWHKTSQTCSMIGGSLKICLMINS